MKNLKRHLSLFMVFSVVLATTVPAGVQAHTLQEHKVAVSDSTKSIADVFNKFRYDMTVEWDQQDPYLKDHAQKELENALVDLKAQGVSDVEIMSYMEANILDAKVRADYKNLVTTMKKQNLTEEAAASTAMKFMEKNYEQGVSFSGGVSANYKRIAIIAGVIIVGVVTFLIIKNQKKSSKKNDEPKEEVNEECQYECYYENEYDYYQ